MNGYECTCPPGFKGKNCEVNINDCEVNIFSEPKYKIIYNCLYFKFWQKINPNIGINIQLLKI